MENYTHEVTAFYDNRAEAEAARERVVGAGIPAAQVRLVEGDESGTTASEDRGFFEKLGDLFMPDEDRAAYAEGLRRGGYLLAVGTNSGQYDEVAQMLDEGEAADFGQREESWRSEGWSGYEAGGGTRRAGAAERDGTIEVAEERLRVGKRDTSHGRVKVRSYVVSEEVSQDVQLEHEHVEVERRAVDRPVGAGDDAFREQSIELEERAEEAVVSKEARVTEEIDLRKTTETETERVGGTVRHTEVDIDDERARAKGRDDR